MTIPIVLISIVGLYISLDKVFVFILLQQLIGIISSGILSDCVCYISRNEIIMFFTVGLYSIHWYSLYRIVKYSDSYWYLVFCCWFFWLLLDFMPSR